MSEKRTVGMWLTVETHRRLRVMSAERDCTLGDLVEQLTAAAWADRPAAKRADPVSAAS